MQRVRTYLTYIGWNRRGHKCPFPGTRLWSTGHLPEHGLAQLGLVGTKEHPSQNLPYPPFSSSSMTPVFDITWSHTWAGWYRDPRYIDLRVWYQIRQHLIIKEKMQRDQLKCTFSCIGPTIHAVWWFRDSHIIKEPKNLQSFVKSAWQLPAMQNKDLLRRTEFQGSVYSNMNQVG
jgi:hypothetical protein